VEKDQQTKNANPTKNKIITAIMNCILSAFIFIKTNNTTETDGNIAEG
jgi:hypothetical protein